MIDGKEGEVRKLELKFDLNKLKEIGLKGVNRASAFMCLGLTPTLGDPPSSVTLDSAMGYRFLPDPLPDDLAKEIVSEYRVWIIGNALRELDLSCHLFLDEAWRVAQWLSRHNQRLPSDFKVPEIRLDTNAASKLEKVYRALNASLEDDFALQVRSLANARNSLTHYAGFVTDRHVNRDENRMVVYWLGQEIRLRQGDNLAVLSPEGRSFQAPDPTQQSTVEVEFKNKEKEFSLGQRVEFSPHEMQEICFFYVILTERVFFKLKERFKELGLIEKGARGTAG